MTRNLMESSNSENSEDFQTFPISSDACTFDLAALGRYVCRYADMHHLSQTEAVIDIATKSTISPKTIENWLNGKVKKPYVKTLRKVESHLGLVKGETIIVETRGSTVPLSSSSVPSIAVVRDHETPIRNIAGRWYFVGQNQNTPYHLSFTGEPKTTFGYFDVTMDPPTRLRGIGYDQDNDQIDLQGELLGEGTFLRGTYDLAHPSILVSGTFFLRIHESATMMFGAGIQRETGQEARYNMVLMDIVLSREPIDADYFESQRPKRRNRKAR